MDDHRPAPALRPPVLLGCTAALAVLLAVVVLAGACITFLESGADDGKVVLERSGVYPPDSITRVPSRGIYVVHLPGEGIFAISDIDAANRQSPGRRCRAEQIAPSDPAYAAARAAYEARFSPAALLAPIVLRETCNGALFDGSGTRVDRDGPNLDRFAVVIDEQDRVVVDTARRTCTEGALASRVEVPCP